MFLYYFNMMEKMAFVQLAKEIVTIDDGLIDDYEQNLLAIMANEMQISVENTLSIEFDIDQLAGKFDTEQAQRICVAELYSLAIANNNFHEKQEDLLKALTVRFVIGEDDVRKLKEWVEEAMKVTKHGHQIIIEGGE